MNPYQPRKIERKWQERWRKADLYRTPDIPKRDKRYVLDMFPYPSGAGLHVGHPLGYIATDVLARHFRMKGYDVLHPMGWDAFGLPAENYAIKNKIHPSVAVKQNIEGFKQQLDLFGFSYDWSREINTTDPEYYKWTQWIFLELFKQGLAYEAELPINWCPKDKTGLANEEVVNGLCERCGTPVERRNLRQWVLKITEYADRLLNDLDELDWPERIKEMQRNWIGRSEGAEVVFDIKNANELTSLRAYELKVFTTRPDTLFGATYVTLAPEHPLLQGIGDTGYGIGITNTAEVATYVEAAKNKSDLERQEAKEKTGVKLEGVVAVNPMTKEDLPVFVADYVLGHYGTGAIMAVPAHDERDYEFATRFGLPIRQVIAPHLYDDESPPRSDKDTVERTVVQGIVKHWAKDEVLQIVWKKMPWKTFVIGGAEDGETMEEAVAREVREETGYQDIKAITRVSHEMRSEWFAAHKDENRYARMHVFLVELGSSAQEELTEEENAKHDLVWVPFREIPTAYHPVGELPLIWQALQSGKPVHAPFTGEGLLINSGEFSEVASAEARMKITEQLAKQGSGEAKVQYKLRDWIFSRQRYWGEPIPLVFCEHCAEETLRRRSGQTRNKKQETKSEGEKINPGWVPVPEDHLPVKLPEVASYEPTGTGESPLAAMPDFVNTTCPNCGGEAKRETNTMPQWAGSCWYYLRYIDPKNSKRFVDAKKEKAWMPVDLYLGGAEHAVLHLLYARFWHKVLFDRGHVSTNEPFAKLFNQGMILGPDHQKMSKSRGNVINPDEVIEQYGADAFRLYEMFMGPLNQEKPWDTQGMIGLFRFLKKTYELAQSAGGSVPPEPGGLTLRGTHSDAEAERARHRLIKKVTGDIEKFDMNTAIAAMMEFLNARKKGLSQKDTEALTLLLAPFAPHLSEEIWQEVLKREGSVHAQPWPEYDETVTKEETVTIAVQVNGKLRGTVAAAQGSTEAEVVVLANSVANVVRALEGKEIKKTIFVPDKIVNFIV